MPRPVAITKVVGYDTTRILINGVTHLAFVRREVAGFQAWRSVGVFSLQLTFKHGATITTEYDDADKWRRIIVLIEDELTP